MTDLTAPQWKYDEEVSMGYLKFNDLPINRTLEGPAGVNVDVDDHGTIVGIEVFL
jgi:uncharacterized protein YuzE